MKMYRQRISGARGGMLTVVGSQHWPVGRTFGFVQTPDGIVGVAGSPASTTRPGSVMLWYTRAGYQYTTEVPRAMTERAITRYAGRFVAQVLASLHTTPQPENDATD